ncbi:MAG: cyclic dehypoxanthinyl futalosine synthase [Nitrospinota bacterium]
MSIKQIINHTLGGRRLTEKDAILLLKSNNLLELGFGANRIRQQKHPNKVVTYIVDRNINYTNICVAGCKFCAFWRAKDSKDAYLLTDEDLDQKIIETKELGGNQILMQGGLHPDFQISWYESLLKKIKSRHSIDIHAFSGPEITHIAKLSNLSIAATLKRLKSAGLDSIPGGGAEILSDRVRSKLSPNKADANEWLEVMEEAHNLGIKSSATMMFGHEESIEERVESIEKIRALQDRSGGFTAFILWPLQPNNTKMDKYKKVGGFEFLKNLAVARLYLDNIDNIQTSWVTQGDKIGAISLFYGANDFGSTMIEENVVKEAGVAFNLNENDIRRIIVDAGFIPKRRKMDYSLIED